MKQRLLFVTMSVLIAMSMLLSACGTVPTATTVTNASAEPTSNAPAEPTTIRVVSFLTYDENLTGAENKVVEAFQAAHPEIKVDFQLLPYADYFTSLKTWIAGGTAPDVASMDISMLQESAANDALADLNPMIQEQNYDLSQYYDSTINMFKNEKGQYGLPASFSNVVIFYNKELFDAAGLAYPDANMDWPTFMENAKTLTQDTNADGITDVFGTARLWWPYYLLMNDAPVISADGTKCVLTDQAAVDGFQTMVDLTLTDKVAPSANDIAAQSDWNMFMAGRIAMYPIGPWGIAPFNEITEFEWDAVELPAGPSGNKATFLFGNAYAILAGSPNQKASFEFLKFATGPEGDKIRQDAGYEIAPIKTVAESSFLSALEGKEPANANAFLTSAEFAKTVPTHKRWSEISDAISAQLDLALLGQQTVPESMQNACQSIDPILAEE